MFVYIFFCGLCFWYHIQETIAKAKVLSFIVLSLYLIYINYFLCIVRGRKFNFILLHVDTELSQHHFFFFKLKYNCCTVLYVTGIQYGDSQFLQVTLHLQLLQNIGYLPHVAQYILVSYFIPNSLYPLLLYPFVAPPVLPLPAALSVQHHLLKTIPFLLNGLVTLFSNQLTLSTGVYFQTVSEH